MKQLIITVTFTFSSLALAENALSQERIKSALADITNNESYEFLQEYAETVTEEEARLFASLLIDRMQWVQQQRLSPSTLLIGALTPILLMFVVNINLTYYRRPILPLLGNRPDLKAYLAAESGTQRLNDAINAKINKIVTIITPFLLFAEAWYLLLPLAHWISIEGTMQLDRIYALLETRTQKKTFNEKINHQRSIYP